MPSSYNYRQNIIQDIHISKSIISTFEKCRLSYYYEKVEKRAKDVPDSPQQIKGTAAHKAVEMLLLSQNYQKLADRYLTIDRALIEYDLTDADRNDIKGWAIKAEDFARSRGGTFKWIEQLMGMKNRLPNGVLWGKFDAAIENGAAAPLEIIDWTFGKPRVGNNQDLLHSLGTYAYRLIAGAEEAQLRPIAITEVHVPTMQVWTVIPDEKEVIDGWNRMKEAAEAIREAKAKQEFPASVGYHCKWCSYRVSCPEYEGGA